VGLDDINLAFASGGGNSAEFGEWPAIESRSEDLDAIDLLLGDPSAGPADERDLMAARSQCSR
jgi:hypothetical protein